MLKLSLAAQFAAESFNYTMNTLKHCAINNVYIQQNKDAKNDIDNQLDLYNILCSSIKYYRCKNIQFPVSRWN